MSNVWPRPHINRIFVSDLIFRSYEEDQEIPRRGRFRRIGDRGKKEQPHEGNDTSEMSSNNESQVERSRRRPRTRNQKKRMKDSSSDSSSSDKTTRETRGVVTRSMKVHDAKEDSEDSTDDLEDESDGTVKMSKKSHTNVISSSSDDDTDGSGNGIDIEVKTRSFLSKYRRQCAHPTCQDQFIVGETKIIGVYLDGQRSWNGKPLWICAKHSSFTRPKEVQKQRVKEYLEEEEEPNTEDEDFIDDGESIEDKRVESFDEDNEDNEDKEDEEGEDESSEGDQSEDSSVEEDVNSEMKDIVQNLMRKTQNDEMNRSKYLDEHSKYQLQIHTNTNPGLHLSPEKRYRRNLRTAKFDNGLKEERGLGCGDHEYGLNKVVLLLDGTSAKIFPQTIKASKFKQFCALEGCDQRFQEGTKIIGTMFLHDGRFLPNDKGNLSYICCNHVEAEDLAQEE